MFEAPLAERPGAAPGLRASGVEGGGPVGGEGIDQAAAPEAGLVVEPQGVQAGAHDLGRQPQLLRLAFDGLATAGDLAPLAERPHADRGGAAGHEALPLHVQRRGLVGGAPAPQSRLGVEGQLPCAGVRGGVLGREWRRRGGEGEGEPEQGAGQQKTMGTHMHEQTQAAEQGRPNCVWALNCT